MTTTTVDPTPVPTGRCIVCERDDLPVTVSGRKDTPDVIARHPAADMSDRECLGSRLPVLPADQADDTPVDAIRRYACRKYLETVRSAIQARAELANALLDTNWSSASALDYYKTKAVRLEQEGALWQSAAYAGDWVPAIAEALQVLGHRGQDSSGQLSHLIIEEKREGARNWIRAARFQITAAYIDSGITGEQVAEILFNV